MLRGKSFFSLSLPYQVLIAAALGILAGLIIGPKVAILQPIGTIYAMLMEVVAIPYVACTLITSLGNLTPELSLRLFKKSWDIYFWLLLITFGLMLVLGQAIPLNIQAFSSDHVSSELSLLNLLIPENIFNALSNNHLPAIVVFCCLFGFAFQFISQKTPFFNVLEAITAGSLMFWNGLIKFTPLAAFASLATIFGEITLDKVMNLSEFLILFFVGTLLLIFWIIPGVITSLTPISYKSLLQEMSHALIISAATTLSVVALPYVRAATAKFIADKKQKENTSEMEDIIKTINSISYPFGQLGNFFIYIFMLFALLYFNKSIDHFHYVFLPFISYFSSIGSPSTSIDAVKLLSDWLNLPSDNTTNLYIGLLPLIRYAQVLVSVMGFAFLSILISFVLFHRLSINYKKLLSHLLPALALVTLLVWRLSGLFPTPGEKSYERLNNFSISPDLVKSVQATILPSFNEAEVAPVRKVEDTLARIQKTGLLRVGFNADMRPFVFYNAKNQLVGYDVEYAYALANNLNCRIEFVPFTWEYLVQDLEANQFDIAIGAIYVTEKRLERVNFTEPYFRSPISVIVPQRHQSQFQDINSMTQIQNLRVGLFKDPVLIPLVKKNLPNAQLVILPSASGQAPLRAFENNEIDAVVWSQVQTEVWTWAHPSYRSITPTGLAAPFLMAYMVQRDSGEFVNFLNYWLELKQNDGFKQAMHNKWILTLP